MSELDQSADSRGARARAAREALIGQTVAGRYRLHALVGHGGMGAVYEAEHLGLGKRVAIKFIDADFATDERVMARFAREARAMSAIESPHIVSVFDVGTEEGRPYLVMELLRGEDLGQRLRRTRRVPVADAMHVVAQVLSGLAKAHAAGIVHRDLKPDNVFLTKVDADPLFAKIVDFGVSKIERPRDRTSPLALTGRGTVLGTPFYMCPEQAQAMPDVDARADLYSVGAILFECLSGRPPHTGETYEQVILSICMSDAPDLRAIDPNLPAPVAAFVARALARDRTQRFASATRMLAALHEVAVEEKARVPVESGAPATLMSPGVLFPSAHKPSSDLAPPSMATRISGSNDGDPGAPVSQVAPQTIVDPVPAGLAAANRVGDAAVVESSAASIAGVPSGRRTRRAPLVLMAAVATLTGIGATLGIIKVLEKKPEAPVVTSPSGAAPVSPATITSGVASTMTTTPSAAVPTDPPAPVVAAPSSAPPAKPAPKAGGKRTGPRPGPVPTKPLDISRDLP